MRHQSVIAVAAIASIGLSMAACGRVGSQSPTAPPAQTAPLAQTTPMTQTAPPAQTPAPARTLAPTMTLQAYSAELREHILRADTDHDGRVSLKQWIAWRAAHPGRMDPTKEFDRYDLNHDGFISPDELDTIAAKKFARFQSTKVTQTNAGVVADPD